MDDVMDYASDKATDSRIMDARVEALRRVSDFVLETQEESYIDACEKTDDDEPYGHIYIYAQILNAWLEELEKGAGGSHRNTGDDPLAGLCGAKPAKRSLLENLFLGATLGAGVAVGIALVNFFWKLF